ncbi:ribonuclease 3-like protein 1 isoform X2 [Arachis duranensis]|uniref:Ribonuclease 3-like protein 1 isoform X2 n=1 Tax=Arachis duranensis TaxID=130453 RepID=A0A6P5MH75_ARADU|nr:ribonuclease 3-like protein 1 isoform X2 [Arachis duranensis]XP_020983811.1 ribonuclease 3-like protein 1 isoform X2 [Arachis duranensis]
MDSDKGILERTPLQKGDTCDSEKNASSQSPHEQGMNKKPARSNLYEICAANHWKPPLFECYKKDGPCHQIMFTFKVTIEIEDASRNIIECYGAPQRKKKTAADDAAEGALWYLKNIGYGMKNK